MKIQIDQVKGVQMLQNSFRSVILGAVSARSLGVSPVDAHFTTANLELDDPVSTAGGD